MRVFSAKRLRRIARCLVQALFLASMSDLGILNLTKEPGRKESPLATTNINPFPAKQPCVYRPCARSEQYQAYSERREQKDQFHFRRLARAAETQNPRT